MCVVTPYYSNVYVLCSKYNINKVYIYIYIYIYIPKCNINRIYNKYLYINKFVLLFI